MRLIVGNKKEFLTELKELFGKYNVLIEILGNNKRNNKVSLIILNTWGEDIVFNYNYVGVDAIEDKIKELEE